MRTIRMVIDLTYDEDITHGTDHGCRDWFYNEILRDECEGGLLLHSNEIGDEIGTVRVVKILGSKKRKDAA